MLPELKIGNLVELAKRVSLVLLKALSKTANSLRSDSAVFESNAKFHRLRVCGPPANAPAQKMLHGAVTGLRSGYW